ncbi:PREDICTED: ribonuclease H2 subunit B [Nelumbo nucifera]|uniref:Ribonuclease H2 subunit B n=1 Tax=Nelumbo nucifera TaxID=4432 RepID=A0A1U8Q4H9_NELNU|nr:PREDICTED: ribonuclease H2 subunit B [Nelumbo nucifera]
MAWWDNVAETRIVIAPEPGSTISARNGEGCFLFLRHPKSGDTTSYFFINGSIQEFHWFKQSYGSWFIGDYVCEDGCLYTATPIDPIFILLPIFEEARMKKANDQGKFRPLDEILFVSGYPGYQHLLCVAEDSMRIVCEIKEIGSTKFYRLDDSKVLAWLCHKVHQLKLTLPTLDKNYAALDEKDTCTMTEVVLLLGEYLKEPWLKLLCGHLKLDLQEASGKVPTCEILPTTPQNTSGSSSQVKSGSDKKTSSNAKQAKKMKMETNSQNIKDMFRRATRRGS